MQERTIKWNKDRGLLESFDPALEIKMLHEELREFYMAGTLAHKAVEYADFLFVLDGTKAKFACRPAPTTTMFSIEVDNYNRLIDWAHNMILEMEMILLEMNNTKYSLDELIELAQIVVVKNNELKSAEKKDGKVVKSENQVDPANILDQYIKEHV